MAEQTTKVTTTRCLFRCDSVKRTAFGGNEVELAAEYDTTVPLERRFSEATPSGSMKMFISNPATKDFFEPGKKYFLDIHEAVPDENGLYPGSVKAALPLPE